MLMFLVNLLAVWPNYKNDVSKGWFFFVKGSVHLF